jgi:hypothetical protein
LSEMPRSLNWRALSRHYYELDGTERFRLALEAAARDDERERERLRDTAPMRRYKITDPAYMDRVDASRQLAVTFALFALPASAELHGWLRCARDHLHEGSPVDAVPADVLARMADVSACYAAFGRVCREEMGLEPGAVLRAHLDPLVNVNHLEKLEDLGGAALDPAAVERWAEVFRQGWEKLT